MGALQNPFLYGNPVPPDRFFGRSGSVEIVYSRLNNGESTAIVGEPHVGKSSLLGYLADDKTKKRKSSTSSKQAFIEINCQALPASFKPSDFWADVISQIEASWLSPTVQNHLSVLAHSAYGSLMLERFFRQLARERIAVV